MLILFVNYTNVLLNIVSGLSHFHYSYYLRSMLFGSNFKPFRFFVLLNTLKIPLNTNVSDLLHLHYSYYLIYLFIYCSDFFFLSFLYFFGEGFSKTRGEHQQPTPVFLPEESHGKRSMAGYSP